MITFLAAAGTLVFWELVKQLGVAMTKRYVPLAVARGLAALDQLLPQLLDEGVTGAELEEVIRLRLGELTDSDWMQIRERFDPVVFLDKQLQ